MSTVSSKLNIEMNTATGSVFYQTHQSDDINGALRFWMDSTSTENVLYFRFRLTPRIEVLNFKHYLEAMWPGVIYSGNGSAHASVAGAIYLKDASTSEEVMAMVASCHVADHLRDLLEPMFPGLTPILTPEEFSKFLEEQVQAALLQSPPKAKKSAVILTFGDKTKDLATVPSDGVQGAQLADQAAPHGENEPHP